MKHLLHLSGDEVINVAFGLAAVFLNICMIWQAAKYAAKRDPNQHAARDVEVSLVSAAILDKVPPQMPRQDGFVERQQQVQAPSGDVVYVTVLVKGPADGPIVPPLTHGHACWY